MVCGVSREGNTSPDTKGVRNNGYPNKIVATRWADTCVQRQGKSFTRETAILQKGRGRQSWGGCQWSFEDISYRGLDRTVEAEPKYGVWHESMVCRVYPRRVSNCRTMSTPETSAFDVSSEDARKLK